MPPRWLYNMKCKIWRCWGGACCKWVCSLTQMKTRFSRWDALITYGLLVVLAPVISLLFFLICCTWLEYFPFGVLVAFFLGSIMVTFFIYCFIALGVRRFHDAGVNGVWLAIV